MQTPESNLVLGRREGQSIRITTPTGRVSVHVSSIRGDRVRIRVTAPRSWRVDREEYAARGDAEREESRGGGAS